MTLVQFGQAMMTMLRVSEQEVGRWIEQRYHDDNLAPEWRKRELGT